MDSPNPSPTPTSPTPSDVAQGSPGPEPAIPGAQRPFWRQERWRYAIGFYLLGAIYALVALLTGIDFRLGARDVTFGVITLLEVSFALFGYLLGLTMEARRGERQAAAEAQRRLREVSELRSRVAQAEKLASLGQLASAVAHEMRNPLAIVRSMAQNLAEELGGELDGELDGGGEGGSNEGARRACVEIQEEIDRLDRVTSHLVDFARPLTPRPRLIEMPELAAKVVLLSEPLLEARGLRLQTEGNASVRCHADPDLLCQVLLGLVENAAAASTDHGRLVLGWGAIETDEVVVPEQTLPRGPGQRIWVEDSGPGVDEELRERVFEPFFTTRDDGHGLGLSVARQVVEAHGGRLTVESGTEGARFLLWLPAAPRLASAPDLAPDSAPDPKLDTTLVAGGSR